MMVTDQQKWSQMAHYINNPCIAFSYNIVNFIGWCDLLQANSFSFNARSDILNGLSGYLWNKSCQIIVSGCSGVIFSFCYFQISNSWSSKMFQPFNKHFENTGLLVLNKTFIHTVSLWCFTLSLILYPSVWKRINRGKIPEYAGINKVDNKNQIKKRTRLVHVFLYRPNA